MSPTGPIGEGAPRQLLPVLPFPDGTADGMEGGMTVLGTDGMKPLSAAAGPDLMGIGAHAEVASTDSCGTCVTDGGNSGIEFPSEYWSETNQIPLSLFFRSRKDASTDGSGIRGQLRRESEMSAVELVELANKTQVLRRRGCRYSGKMEVRWRTGVNSFASC